MESVQLYTDTKGVKWVVGVMAIHPGENGQPDHAFMPFGEPHEAQKYAASIRKRTAERGELPFVFVYLQATRFWTSADEKIANDESVIAKRDDDDDHDPIDDAPEIKAAFDADKLDAEQYTAARREQMRMLTQNVEESDDVPAPVRKLIGAIMRHAQGQAGLTETPTGQGTLLN